ncbi:glutathione synthetase, chloroplastic-like, partial [Pistacia vera]|uniref:glutathione synthetase, chloroplastic-like n=1 Tax=Pistacia vera TaxID=55513 RepID=UPI00126313A3
KPGPGLGLDSKKIPGNSSVSRFAEAMAKAWTEYNNPGAVVMVVAQSEERNMYDQHWLCSVLKEKYNVTTIRKTLAEIDMQGELLPDGTLLVGGQAVSVVYFRAGYAPTDYPSESEWSARLLMEQSSAIKCPSISYHLAGTKKIQQELAKPNVLERFLDNKEDIAKVRKCFAGLWSLDDSEIVSKAIERPELYVMKPQREGGGNNIYGEDVRETLLRLKKEGSEEDAAYILMQRIFPSESLAYLMRDGVCHKDQAISELGIYGAYLRNKDKVIMNEQCGYLMRTKISSSNEGGVAAGFAVLDSIYLT